MKTKDEILNDLQTHVNKLDPQHQELALVAIIETEVQIDIRDVIRKAGKDIQEAIWNMPVKD